MHNILRGVARHAGWTLVGVFLLLLFLRSTHNLPSGYGIEDFLAFTDAGAINAAIERWAQVKWYGFAYIVLDLLVFIPTYTLVTLRLVAWLHSRADCEGEQRALVLIGWVIVAALACLVVIDLVETSLGLAKLQGAMSDDVLHGESPPAGAISFAIAATFVCTLISFGAVAMVFRDSLMPRDRISALVGAAIGMTWLVAWTVTVGDSNPSYYCASPKYAVRVGCISHRSKTDLFIWLWVIALSCGVLAWFSGAWTESPISRARRARLRSVVFDVVTRSRYTVIGLLLLALLLLGLDQCRDVLVGTVSDVTPGSAAGAWWPIEAITVLVSLVSLWTLSHTCWLWARVQSRIPGTNRILARALPAEKDDADAIARSWARALGTVPLLLFAGLASKALSALSAAALAKQNPQVAGEVFELFLVANAAIFVGAAFIITREIVGRRQAAFTSHWEERYYDDPSALRREQGAPDGTGKLRFSDWKGPRWKFCIVFPNSPVWLPLASLAGLVAVRTPLGWGSHAWLPMAFPILLFAFSAWIGVFGWLSVYERRYAMPWGLIPLVIAGWFGVNGWADNHIVATPGSVGADALPLWLRSSVLAMIVGACGWWAVAYAPDRLLRWKLGGAMAVLGILIVGLWASDSWRPGWAGVAPAPKVVEGQGTEPRKDAPTVDHPCVEAQGCLQPALAKWLEDLRENHKDETKQAIYFVATEGGGARAAYWTAKVLEKLAMNKEKSDFLAHTFAISGVSGGSVGAAAFIACDRELHGHADKLHDCLDRFGKTDLISPLLGAWFFEDVIARVIPTSVCEQAGCGFMSRSIWFETVLTQKVKEMNGRLKGNRPTDRHQPYLLLNSTWVEGGGRVIASDLTIDPREFPTAIGTLDLIHGDLSLATAAHNSARFPFVNAIGLVKTWDCPKDIHQNVIASQKHTPVRCLHLADGGYFDNGGTQSIIDVLRALRDWMHENQPPPHKCAADTKCSVVSLTPDQELVNWVQTHLEPRLILIHNGIKDDECAVTKTIQPDARAVGCIAKADGHWNPENPHPRPVLDFFSDAMGPVVTAITAGGLGANRDRADALLCAELGGLLGEWGENLGAEPQLLRYAQIQDGRLYPLGWYLSAEARKAMDGQITGASVKETRCSEERLSAKTRSTLGEG